jgi:hypothetical protein
LSPRPREASLTIFGDALLLMRYTDPEINSSNC